LRIFTCLFPLSVIEEVPCKGPKKEQKKNKAMGDGQPGSYTTAGGQQQPSWGYQPLIREQT